MSEFDWDKVEASRGDRPPWVEWPAVGAKFIGTITDFREHTFPPRKGEEPKPTTVIDMIEWGSNEPRSLSLGPIDLRVKLKELRPQKGDMLKITFSDEERIDGSPSPMKIFTIEHKKAEPVSDPFESAPPVEEAPPPEEFSSEPF